MTTFTGVISVRIYAILIAVVFSPVSPNVGAEQKTLIEDSKSGYVVTLDTSEPWQTDSQKGRDGITVCAVPPASVEPLATICVKTLPQIHSKAVDDDAYASELLRGLLDGVCKPFKCDAASKGNSEAKNYGSLKGWQLTTNLELAAYKNAGLSGTVFFAALTPKGQMQLFSLHTAKDKTALYYNLLTDGIRSIDFSGQ